MVVKNSGATSWHELLHQLGPFCIEFQKSTKWSQVHRNCTNAPKHEYRVQWGGSRALVAKNSDATSWHELLHQFGPFGPSFVSQPNGPKCTKIVRNAPKHEFRVQWGGTGAFIAKNSDAASWHELLHQFGPFCTDFHKATKWSKMHQNCTKRTKT